MCEENTSKYRNIERIRIKCPGHDRHRNISQIPCILSRPDRVRVSSRDLFEGLSADQSLDQRFPFPGQRRPGSNLYFHPFPTRTRVHSMRPNVSPKKYLFPLRMQMWTNTYVYIFESTQNGEEIRGWTVNCNREEFQGLRRGRNARRILRWINRQVSSMLYPPVHTCQSHVYTSWRNISRSKLDTSG